MKLHSNYNRNKSQGSAFSKIALGNRVIKDPTYIEWTKIKRGNYGDKATVLSAIERRDYPYLRNLSNYFYETSGIYQRLCKYMAYLYKYDWMVVPVFERGAVSKDIVLQQFTLAMSVLDQFGVKQNFSEIGRKVIVYGSYYGYTKYRRDGSVSLQELPYKYCRSSFKDNNRPVVEFQMKYFNECFAAKEDRDRVLESFPDEIQVGYALYEKNKLSPVYSGDLSGWFVLTDNGVKFSLDEADYPLFSNIIPAIIDLSDAQELDRRKMIQKLSKLLIQKIPMDKDGEMLFDPDEIRDLHMNASNMVANIIGVDVLTTFAEVDVEDLSDDNTTTTSDELTKVERSLYNDAGVSQKQFNTDSNLALANSILNDESSLSGLICQFKDYLNYMISKHPMIKKSCSIHVDLLNTTIYNYKDMAKLYKEQSAMGYSKFLPPIALGQSQSSVLAGLVFENDILDFNSLLIAPGTTPEDVAAVNASTGSGDGPGRKELPAEEKSDKTLANTDN